MGSRNNTNVPHFILMRLTDSEVIRPVLFMLFLLIYLIAVLGNAGMILTIQLDPKLCTLMCSFINHLSFLDLCYTIVIIPKTLENLLSSSKYISFMGCFTQMSFFALLGITECFLLSSMAYDHYVAIYNPLHYTLVMSTRLCYVFITASYIMRFIQSLVIVYYVSRLHFCNSNVIYHFFCDTTPILALSCMNTHDMEIMTFILGSLTAMVSLTIISESYGSILSTVLKINSTSGKHKAFSTCASHFLGVTIFYVTTSFTYLKLKKSYYLGKEQVASVFYTMVAPMVNPFIYSMRNKDVKNALIAVMQKKEGSSQMK